MKYNGFAFLKTAILFNIFFPVSITVTAVSPIKQVDCGLGLGLLSDCDSSTTVCPSPTVFIKYRLYTEPQENGVYTFDPYGTNNYTLNQNIKAPNPITGLTADHSGKRLFTVDQANNIIIYSRASCKDKFSKLKASPAAKTYQLALDSTEKYILIRDVDNEKVISWKIKDDGSLVQSDSYVREVNTDYVFEPVFNPKKKDLLAIHISGSNVIQLFRFDNTAGTLKKLQFKAAFPSDLLPMEMAFSWDGKYLYAVGAKNLVYVYEIKMAANYGDVTGFKQLGDPVSTVEEGVKGQYVSNRLAIHPTSGHVYVSNNSPKSITAFKMTNGKLEFLKRQEVVSMYVSAFCVSGDGKQLVVVEGGGGPVAVLAIGNDGLLTKANTLDIQGAESLWCLK